MAVVGDKKEVMSIHEFMPAVKSQSNKTHP